MERFILDDPDDFEAKFDFSACFPGPNRGGARQRRAKKGAPAGAPSAARAGRSGLAAGKTHGRGAGAVVGLDVDEADHALLDLAPGALQRWADLLGLFDIFGIAAQGLGHLVVARVAEITPGLVALRVSGPTAIEADHAQERQFVPHRGVELHRVLPERAVAVQANDLCRGLGGLGADCERQPYPHRAKGSGIEPVPGDKGRDRLAAEIQDLLPVDRQDRLALHKVLDLLAQPQRMDVAVRRVVAAGADALLRLAVSQFLAPRLKAVGGTRIDRLA